MLFSRKHIPGVMAPVTGLPAKPVALKVPGTTKPEHGVNSLETSFEVTKDPEWQIDELTG
jgi:hypothetical protein